MPTANGYKGGTWYREADGACLLMYSPQLYVDPPTAYRNKDWNDKWYRTSYDRLPENTYWPEDIDKLAPGEWVRIH